MQARVLDIYAKYGEYIKAIVPLKIEDEYMSSGGRTGSLPSRPAWKM